MLKMHRIGKSRAAHRSRNDKTPPDPRSKYDFGRFPSLDIRVSWPGWCRKEADFGDYSLAWKTSRPMGAFSVVFPRWKDDSLAVLPETKGLRIADSPLEAGSETRKPGGRPRSKNEFPKIAAQHTPYPRSKNGSTGPSAIDFVPLPSLEIRGSTLDRCVSTLEIRILPCYLSETDNSPSGTRHGCTGNQT